MDAPKHVLLVTNSTSEEELSLIQKALVEANKNQSMHIKLSLVHVIPNMPTCYFNIPSMVLVAEQYYEEAKKCLSSIGNTLDVDKNNQWLITGRVKTEVLRLASKLQADFILASSSHIQDLHKSFLFKKPHHYSLKNISNLGRLVTL